MNGAAAGGVMDGRTAGALRDLWQAPRVEQVRALLCRYGAPILSGLVLLAAMAELRVIDWGRVVSIVPHSPLFWAVFAVTWFTPVMGDWVIYHRLWQIPLSGLLPLTRKMIGNNLVVGYAGEAYLYAWARRRGISDGAFSAVKDVAILSASVGNALTVAVALLAFPFMAAAGLHLPVWTLVPSLAIIAVPPIVAVVLRKRVFGRGGADLLYVAGAHAARAMTGVVLTALLWHLVLPQVAPLWWFAFAALKMLVSRLPLVAQKDLVFAGMAAALLGRGTDVAALMAMMATLAIVAEVVVGLGTSALDMVGGAMRRMRLASGDLAGLETQLA